MKFFASISVRKIIALFLLLLIAFLFHYPRIFFIADESARFTGKLSLLKNYPVLCKWDCPHYHYLADASNLQKDSYFAAFFPALPLILKLLHHLLPKIEMPSLSVIVSNFFSLLAIAFIVLLGSRLHSKEARNKFGWNRSGLLLAFLIAIYPHSQFWSYGYNEPLFILMYAGSLLCLVVHNFRAASVCCGLAAVTRPQGIWVLGVFLVLACDNFLLNRVNQKISFKRIKEIDLTFFQVLFMSLFPFFLFLIWQWKTFGHPFSFLKVQSMYWERSFDLVGGIKSQFPKFQFTRILNIFALYSSYRFIKRNGVHWKMIGITTFLMTEIPLFFGGYLSYLRFSSFNLGIFVALVELTRNRFWWAIALMIFALTGLDAEVHRWLNLPYFMF